MSCFLTQNNKENKNKLKTKYRFHIHTHTGTEYFYREENLARVCSKGYVPTNEDILMVRHRTTGVIEQKFMHNGYLIHSFITGGQRSERKKWIHCFEHVSIMPFIVGIDGYNAVMFEDDSCNYLDDALDCWEEICNLSWFADTRIVLIFNGMKKFGEKLKKFPFTVCNCFQDYQGSNEPRECIDFLKQLFESKFRREDKSNYFYYEVESIDIEQVARAVRNMIDQPGTKIIKGDEFDFE